MVVRILDVCSGTGSVERWVQEYDLFGHVDVTSVDIQVVQGRQPTHLADVLEWDFRAAYPPGHFDIVWASPPCTMYSVARTVGGPRDLATADRIVARCLEMITYFRPTAWFMENPASSLLKTRDVVRGLPYVDASYCQYGKPYRKTTRFWSNLASPDARERNGFPGLALTACDPKMCPAMVDAEGTRVRHHTHQLSCNNRLLRVPQQNKWMSGQVPLPLLDAMLGPVVRAQPMGVHQFV